MNVNERDRERTLEEAKKNALPMLRKLKEAQVGEICCVYSGSDNRGTVSGLIYKDRKDKIILEPNAELRQLITDATSAIENLVVASLPGHWKRENGSEGSFAFDLTNSEANCNHYWRELLYDEESPAFDLDL